VQAPYTPKPTGELGGPHSRRRECLSCRRNRFKISLKVAALNVAAPFTVALNGDATILAPVAADELVAKVGHRNAR
jgi:hypothetical protein